MTMRAFVNDFPELGRKECRIITLPQDFEGVPAGRYALVEMFCDEPDCDCQRVSLRVTSEATDEMLCLIDYGFDRTEPLAGPFLDPLHPCVKYSDSLLSMVSGLVLSDPQYVARVKRHYRMFKEKIGGGRRGKRAFAAANLPRDLVAERIRERKRQQKAFRQAQQRRRAR